MKKQIVIATRNKQKVKEISFIFNEINKNYEFELLNLNDIKDLPKDFDVEETGKTYEENAILKAKGYGEKINKIVLADDSGLNVDAMQGRPGVYSARYCDNDWAKGCQMVIKELEDIEDDKRGAQFVCVMAVYNPKNKKLKTFKGEYNGKILKQMKGKGGFGYDPIFYNQDLKLTNAEMSQEQKNKVSHRRKALEKVYKILKQEFFN